ncbi:hypothetical protein JKP88DRAFT_270350 [Tribonema minus]|uniref:rhomboid protease n=1 Tax=Tribonema minus TaxID=303371 RepID=A0A835YQV6_9STRA|nr:hypothetical protein JKP88DRAFT_270350 [Tribonema minus]
MLIWEFSVNDWKIEPLSVNPSIGVSAETLVECGAKVYDLIVNGEAYRLLSAVFLHAGIIHFIFNMLALFSIGAVLERVFGGFKVLVIFIVSGVFSTAVSAIFLPYQVMVGASGAILGLLGGVWADLLQNWSLKQRPWVSIIVLFTITAVNLLLGLMPYLDNFAHMGGLVMGFFCSLPLLVMRAETAHGKLVAVSVRQRILQALGLVTSIALLVAALVVLFGSEEDSVNEWCSWCSNLSCVEFPKGDPLWRCDECSQAGFEAVVGGDGSVALTCPDSTHVQVAAGGCNYASSDELTQCCIANCL